MKKRTRMISLLLVLSLALCSFTGCGKKGAESEGTTVATKLCAQFKEEVKNTQDLAKIADALIGNSCVKDVSMGYVDFEEGYLNGFDGEIYGFNNCVMFAPFIGTIPFVGYLFETDDPDALKATLESKAMLNWNICTVADEMVIDSEGNIVFFCMAPESFDE